ncbi:MAG TPA: hypothetical protein VIK88_02730 [Candidatus Bathyarchaeia archaeon]
MEIPGLGAGSLLVGFLILFIIYLIIVGFVLWAAGEIVVGRRVTFGQAFAIAGVGTFLVGAVLFFLPSLLGLLAGFVLFLWIIRHYFKTGWFGAFGVTIMAVIVGVVLTFVLGALTIGLFSIPTISRFI